MNIFELIEELCWKDIVKYITIDVKNDLDLKQKETIKENIIKNNDKNQKVTNLEILISVLRKYISRYCINSAPAENYLYSYLQRIELWPQSIDYEKLEIEIYNMFKKTEIKVSQCYNLYNLLNEEMSKMPKKK